MDSIKVTFQPSGRAVRVSAGATVREAALQAGIAMDYPCGGQGTCGKCRVRVLSDHAAATPSERGLLSPEDLARGIRLACQCAVRGPMAVELGDSAPAALHKVLTGAADTFPRAEDPPIRKRYVELAPPSLEDGLPDAERLCAAAGAAHVAPTLLRDLPRALRDAEFRGTAVVADDTLIGFEPGDTAAHCYAVAFDIGTTTLVAELIDLAAGAIVARSSKMNPQTIYGDDVLSRIGYAGRGEAALEEIHRCVTGAVDAMLAELCAAAGIESSEVYEVCFAGNTTMQHLLAGLDPAALGCVPFVPAVGDAVELPAAAIGVVANPRARAYVHPVIGGFVGGDTVAGISVTRLEEARDPVMLVDIGTNGEIALFHDGELLCASCATGPAFEGARISCGMRAAAGAIEEVRFEEDVRLRVIGDVAPTGLCGSALIDAAAELLRSGLLLSQGMLLPPDSLPDALPDALRARVVLEEDGPAFVLATADESGTGRPVILTQRDIRELQLATGAIRAGISILLKRAGLEVCRLGRLYVAGAFGNYVRLSSAQRMGLLPEGLDEARFEFVGNTSLVGARLAAASLGARRRAQTLARRAAHVELSLDPDFQMEFAMAMFFPEMGET